MPATTELPIESIEVFAARLPAPGTVDVSIEVVGEEVGDQIQVQRLGVQRSRVIDRIPIETRAFTLILGIPSDFLIRVGCPHVGTFPVPAGQLAPSP